MEFSIIEGKRKGCFAAYKTPIDVNGKSFTAQLIVFKDQYGIPVHFTQYEIFARPYSERSPKRCDYREVRHLSYVCQALNFILIDNARKFHAKSLLEIAPDMVLSFFNSYCNEPMDNGELRSAQSMLRCVRVVSSFFANVYQHLGLFSPTELMDTRQFKSSKHSFRVEEIFVPMYKPKTGDIYNIPILRDVPFKAMDIILAECKIHYPEIFFAVFCQVLTGLRPSEALNLRQSSATHASSFIMTIIDNEVADIRIDLTTEHKMRSDGINVGGIKKHRMQQVYPGYISVFMAALRWHSSFLLGKKCEEDYAPLFPNREGNAMTYHSYLSKFQSLVQKHVRPRLLRSDDPELQVLGQRLLTENLSPHALRHFFTVDLVLKGLDIAQLQYFRGDSSPESALWYLQNKSVIYTQAKRANEESVEGLVEVGEQILHG